MSVNKKCRAQGGPESCTDPLCPEKRWNLISAAPEFEVPKSYTVQAEKRPSPKVLGNWTNEDTVLFKTPTGSKLYGLANANSDDDYYVITPSKYVSGKSRRFSAKQSFKGNADTVYLDFRSFVKLCGEGIPTTLEVMFSKASRSEFFEDYRQGYFCSDPVVVHKYMSTIKRFSLDTTEKQFKMRRHALRLALNLEEVLYTGRFNPTLSPSQATAITRFTEASDEKYWKELEKISPIEVDWEEAYKLENNL